MSKKQKFTHTIKDRFIKVPAALLRVDLPMGALKVYLYLLDASAAWTPSLRQMVKDLNLSKSAIIDGLRLLEEKGMIVVEKGDYMTKSKYELTRWFEDTPGTKNRPPWSEKDTTSSLEKTPGGGLKKSTFLDERSQMRNPDEKPRQDSFNLAEDSRGKNLPVGKKKTPEEIAKEEVEKEEFRERWDRTLDETFQMAKKK